ncbi:MAG: hypothetical protein JXL97_02990 [Bacteroidales bacterium]|nr:hypothetical protein [Bacteroidales bacterium]
MKKLILIIHLILIFTICKSQEISNDTILELNENDLYNCEIYENIYHCNVGPFDIDDNPIFMDERNFNISMTITNPKTDKSVEIPDEPSVYNLTVVKTKIILNKTTNVMDIEGFVEGGWHGAKSQVYVYIGNKVDTVSYIYLSPSLHGPIYYNGKKVKETNVIDTLPSFKFASYDKSISEVGFDDHKQRAFKISAKINENSILVFGQSSSYSEIFLIGKLLDDNMINMENE